MKRKYLQVSQWLFSGLLTILGFSCAGNTDPVDEYGTPSATYHLKGKVIDKQSAQAIPAARIIITSKKDNLRDTLDTQTNKEGEFEKTYQCFPFSGNLTVVAEDLQANYKKDSVEVSFQKSDFTGGSGNWNWGETTKEITIPLAKTEKDEQ